MSTTTETAPAEQPPAGRLTPELIRQIAALSRESKENLLILLQEELDRPLDARSGVARIE